MNNIFKIPAFQRRKAIPKQLKDLELLPLNEQFSKLTMSIVGDDDMRPVMTGNFFDMESKKIVSTDAHKLTAINMPNRTFDFIKQTYNKELDKEPRGLIFHTLSQLQKDYNKLMKNNNISISFDEFVKDRAIEDGRYPNYEAVIPKEFTNVINVDYQKLYWYTKVLLDAKVIDDVTKINTSNANEYQNKKIEYLKDSYISFLNPVTKQIILTYLSDDGTIQYMGFNARLLCDLLKFAMEFNGKTFGKVGLSGNSRAMVIELENGLNVINDSIGIVMPIMLVSGEFDNTIGDIDFDLSVAMYYDLDTNSIISDKQNYPINESIGFMPNIANLSTPNIRVKEQVSKVENNSADLIDTRIKGYKIALKVAKAENKANIEKKIKGLEIAKKMQKFKTGGSVDEDISWDITIRDEYENETFEINVRGYFENEEDAIKQAIKDYNIYVDESDYGKMYWNGNEITIYGAKKNYKKGGMVEYHDYKGVEIMYEPTYEEYFVNDMVFNTLEKAHKYIDSGEANETPTYIKNLYRRGAMAKGGKVDYYELQTLKNEESILERRLMEVVDNQSDGWRIDKAEIESDLEMVREKINQLKNSYKLGGSVEIERISMKRLLSEFKNEKEIFDGQIVNRGNNQFKIENDIFYIKRPNENWEVFRKIKYEDGGSVDEQVYIDYLNKEKGFKRDRIYFDSYAEAVEWGRKNFERFNTDMINYV